MKAKKLLSLLIVLVLVSGLSITAFAEEKNEILNNAFYIEIPEEFENYSFYSDYYQYISYDNDMNTNEIIISLKENSGLIDNMNEDFEIAKFAFVSFFEQTTLFREDDIVFSKQQISKVNKCSVAEFEAFFDSEDVYESDLYIKGYLFANEQYIYCIIGTSPEKSMNWFDKIVKTFRMNGTLLAGDNQKNDINFFGAIDYKEQLESYVAEYDAFETEDFFIVFAGVTIFCIAPLLVVIIVAIVFIMKYKTNKKILTQYEKTFGLLPGEVNINNDYLNY